MATNAVNRCPLVGFDACGFADAVKARIKAGQWGEESKALRATGIPASTFNRMLRGSAPRNIEAILSAAHYFGIAIEPFFRERR